MPGFFALGSGFLGAANQKLDDIQDERKQNRRLAMEVFVKDTLPKVRAAQAKDDEFVSSVNGMMNDDYYKGNPALAYYSKKWQDRTGKDEMAFREYAVSNQLPPEVKSAAEAELSKYFNIDPNSSQLSWKTAVPSVPTAQPQQQGPRPSFYDRLMGKGNMQQDATAGVKQGAAMAGVDPNASTVARSDTMSIPGGFQSKDPTAERNKSLALQFAGKNPDAIRNYGALISALNSGDSKQVEAQLSNPKFMISREEAKQDSINQQFRMTTFEHALNGSFGEKTPDVLKAVMKGDTAQFIDLASKSIKSDEEKLAYAAKVKRVEQVFGSLDNPEAFKMLRRSGLFTPELTGISEANLTLMEKEADAAIARKEDIMDRIQRDLLNKNLPPEQRVDPNGPPRAPEQGSDVVGVTDGNETDTLPPEAPIAQPEDVLTFRPEGNNAKLKTEGNVTSEQQAKNLSKELSDIGNKFEKSGDVAEVKLFMSKYRTDPVTVIRAAKTASAKKAVGGNLTISPEFLQKAYEDDDTGNAWQESLTSIAEYLPKYKTKEEAMRKADPYSMVRIEAEDGTYIPTMIPPRKGK